MAYISEDIDYGVVAEPELKFQINQDLNLARSIVESTGENLFLTGRAGTGKTTFLHKLRETTAKRMIVLAPTGVAAINARGTTIHSLFQFPFSPYVPGKGFVGEENNRFRFSVQKRKLLRSVELLVIDEVSMVRPDILDAMDATLRRYRDRSRPFGGVQLLLIGDLRQLAPVVREQEWSILKEYYETPYFFQSHALNEAGYHTIELRTVYRQTDARFLEMLNEVREGKISESTLKGLNSHYRPDFEPDDKDGYIRLTALNRNADEVNKRKLQELSTEERTYSASIDGNFTEYSFPVAKELKLKCGAQVMFARNDSGEERRYFNGMIGRVVSLEKGMVKVAPNDGSPAVELERAVWENTRYVVDEHSKEIKQVTDGVFSQFPLRLAWAITIHKSQGLTFDRAVIDATASFASGQVYVALSRCRSLDGLVLSHPLQPSSVICDRNVNDFLTRSDAQRPTVADLERMRANYCRDCLAEMFSFTSIGNELRTFSRLVSEYVAPIYREVEGQFREALTGFENEIEKVGNHFASIYACRPVSDNEIEDNTMLQTKVKSGCGYFTDKLSSLSALLSKVPVDLDNKTYKKRLSSSLESLAMMISVKLRVFGRIESVGFTVAEYTKAKGDAYIELAGAPDRSSGKRSRRRRSDAKQTEPSALQSLANVSETLADAAESLPQERKKKERVKKEKKPKGYSIFETLKLFRDAGKSITEIASERNLVPSTIAKHLAASVIAGDLRLEDVIKPSALQLLTSEWKNTGGQLDIFREVTERSIPGYEVSLFITVMRASSAINGAGYA